MRIYRTSVLVLTIIAVVWRIATWISFERVGYIGLVEDVEGVVTLVSSDSPADKAGLQSGDKIISLDGMSREGRPRPGQHIAYTIERDGVRQVIHLNARKYFSAPILGVMGFMILIIGLLSFIKTQNHLSFVLFLYCFVMCIHWGNFPQVMSDGTQHLIRLFYTYLSIFLGSTILHFALIYPSGKRLSTRKSTLVYSPGIIGLPLLIMILVRQLNADVLFAVEPLLVTLFALTGGVILFVKYFKVTRKDRASIGIGIVCLGILLGNLPYLFSAFLPFMNFGNGLSDLIYRLFFVFGPVGFAMGVVMAKRSYSQ